MSSKVEQAVQNIIATANDNTHGYDQQDRWGEYGDYDCSSLVITCYQNAGVPVKTKGATYTGNMYNAFVACGFQDVTNSVNLSNGNGLVRGDVLLNKVHHTAMYIGGGQIAEAQYSENQSAYGYAGDQTGEEIWTRSYYNYPWDCVLRLVESKTATETPKMTYQAHSSSGWWSEVSGYGSGENGYAGAFGEALTGVRMKSSLGTVTYRVHCINDGWYNWRTNYDTDSSGDTYAGDCCHAIDGVQIKPVGSHHVQYRVHVLGGNWLDWVTDFGDGDEGYAGWYGKSLDGIQIKIL